MDFLWLKKAFSDQEEDIGKSTFYFIKRKFSIIYPYFFVAWCVAFLVDNFTHDYSGFQIFVHLLQSIPFHMQLSMTGIPVYNLLGPTWYISVMLIVMLFMYPMIKKLKTVFIFIIAPLLAIFSYGYLGELVGMLATIEPLEGNFIHTGFYRGIAGISLGCICYGLCAYIRSTSWTKTASYMFALIELCAYFGVILGMQTQNYFRPDFIVVILICVAVTISFSGASITSKFIKKDCSLIGKLSLVLYLSDAPARALTCELFASCTWTKQIIIAISTTLLFGIIVLVGGNFIKSILKKIIFKIKGKFILS